ncbi:MAG TPA: ABC-ATPase domain-containing protein, partial [Bacillota bacterium]|nr:ABC-ATPase domain-containing protein [Bacillota bacterium]
PLDPARAVPFKAPPALAVELACPHRGRVRGMSLPAGVTLIAGGGYHGKSTLLRALERGVYNHIPGDGREGVVTDPLALKIRAEDGRRVEKVDISPFIDDLPFGRSTRSFSTEEASGSTSQAANIIEGLEAGARVLLMDEDTSATNFMIRDRRMQLLVAKDKKPITPFVDRVRQLYRERGVSTILVIGGSGDYFDVADTVIVMESYLPREATAAARQIASRCPTGRRSEAGGAFGEVRHRVPLPGSIDPYKGQRVKISARDEENLLFGSEKIDLRCLEQIVDQSQVRAIGDLIFYALKEKIIDGKNSLAEIAGRLEAMIEQQGLAVISPYRGQPRGDYARPRPLELVAAINRLRTLEIRPG